MQSDHELLTSANRAQKKIEDSGIALIQVETTDGAVLAAIQRVFGQDTNSITFEMYKTCIRNLSRVGMIKGLESA